MSTATASARDDLPTWAARCLDLAGNWSNDFAVATMMSEIRAGRTEHARDRRMMQLRTPLAEVLDHHSQPDPVGRAENILAMARDKMRQPQGEDQPGENALRVVTVEELLALELPPREYFLEPIIQRAGIAMLHAIRGVGKTHVTLGVAGAVATGGTFLRWRAAEPRRVLLVDGEMPAAALQERLSQLALSTGEMPDPSYLRIVTPDVQPGPIPDLATVEGQAAVEAILGDAELLMLDNLSCLCRTGVENDAESWVIIQTWLLKLRRRSIASWIVHHSGKAGAQRGTSKREDLLDTVICLRRPTGYVASEGARFEVHYEKTRGFTGDAAEPFEAKLETTPDGRQLWTMRSLDDRTVERVGELLAEGMKQRDIARELNIGLATVNRAAKRVKA